MDRTRIKICGITDIEDAKYAIKCGADALGFVFCEKSPRNISIEKTQQIISQLPAFVTTVALFMDETRSFVENVINETSIMCLQFHGVESEQFCQQFRKPYIKSIAMGSKSDIRSLELQYKSAQSLLLDSNQKGEIGGSGKTFNWDIQTQLPSKPYILAGGLNPNNVQQAIDILAPFAVDVSSGVEKDKGLKDKTLIKEFINKVYER